MKRLLFAVMLLGSSYSSLAQMSVGTPTEGKRTEEYCMMLATAKMLSTKVTITLDYGQERSLWTMSQRTRDESGKIQNFNSVIDALNFMNGQGWEFVNAYAITIGGSNVYHYVMRRKIAG